MDNKCSASCVSTDRIVRDGGSIHMDMVHYCVLPAGHEGRHHLPCDDDQPWSSTKSITKARAPIEGCILIDLDRLARIWDDKREGIIQKIRKSTSPPKGETDSLSPEVDREIDRILTDEFQSFWRLVLR